MTQHAAEQLEYQRHHSHDNKVAALYGTAVSLAVVAIIAVGLRLVCRQRLKLRLSYDDYTICFALLLALCQNFILAIGVKYGGGRHAVFATPEEVQEYLKFTYAFEIVYNVDLCFIKASILLFYTRIFPSVTSKLWRICLYTTLVGVIAWYIPSAVIVSFQCTPIARMWDHSISGHCFSMPVLYYLGGAYNIASDLVILILPMPIIWRLRLPTSKKFAVTGIFLMGWFVCIVSIVRLSFIHEMSDDDPTWGNVNTAIWSTIEPCIGIVCSCLPVMSPLLRRMRLPCIGARRQYNEPSVPKVSWLHSRFEMDRVWTGRFKRFGEFNDSNADATTDTSLTSRAPEDVENALRTEIVINKTIEVTYEGRRHKGEEAALP